MIVLLPIISTVAFVPLSFFRLATVTTIYVSIVFSALTFLGYILFLSAMKGMSKTYSDPCIFRNSVLGFTGSAVGAIVFSVTSYVFLAQYLTN